MTKEFADVGHPVEYPNGDQGDVEAVMQRCGQMVDVALDEFGSVRRATVQLAGLCEKGCRLIHADDTARTQRKQRQAFPTVIAAQLDYVFAVDVQQAVQGIVEAAKLRLHDIAEQYLPVRRVLMMTGGIVPCLTIALDGGFGVGHFHGALRMRLLIERIRV
jgi:hypothetical protein